MFEDDRFEVSWPSYIMVVKDKQWYSLVGVCKNIEKKHDPCYEGMMVWKTNCPTCKTEFMATSDVNMAHFTRRCVECRKLKLGKVKDERKRNARKAKWEKEKQDE